MLVIGIDPGTATTGYGLVRESESGGLECVAYGVVTTPPKMSLPNRLQIIHRELKQLIAMTEYAKSLGLRVNAVHGLNYGNAKAIAQIQGIE